MEAWGVDGELNGPGLDALSLGGGMGDVGDFVEGFCGALISGVDAKDHGSTCFEPGDLHVYIYFECAGSIEPDMPTHFVAAGVPVSDFAEGGASVQLCARSVLGSLAEGFERSAKVAGVGREHQAVAWCGLALINDRLLVGGRFCVKPLELRMLLVRLGVGGFNGQGIGHG